MTSAKQKRIAKQRAEAQERAERKRREQIASLYSCLLRANAVKEQRDRLVETSSLEQLQSPSTGLLQREMALRSVFYALLVPVLEGWEKVGLRDPDVGRLLKSRYRPRLRQFRHSVFHFNPYSDKRLEPLSREPLDFYMWATELYESLSRAISAEKDQVFKQ